MDFVAHVVKHLEFGISDAEFLVHPKELTWAFAESADWIFFASYDEKILIFADFLELFSVGNGL